MESQPNMPPKSEAVESFDWMAMFNRTFLSLYMDKDDPLVVSNKFDYAFKIGDKLLYVLTHEKQLEVDSPNVSKKLLETQRQQAASQIHNRFQQLINNDVLSTANEYVNVHYIGLTSLTVVHEGKGFPIEHEFGSAFIQQQSRVDADERIKVLQLFSINSFYQMLKLLQTPSDLLSYFDYHLAKLVNSEEFKGEFALAQDFINSPVFYQRAVDVQQKLVEIGLLAKVETRLTDIIGKEQQDNDNPQLEQQLTELSQKLQSSSSIFQKLLNGTTKRRHQAQDTVPLDQVQTLMSESMYTRTCIIEEMMSYENRSKQDRMQGYLCHQHSYNDFGHHYVVVVYGLDNQAQYSRQYLDENYHSLLKDINAQLQNPAMKEYFILGFDLSKDDGQGNVTVLMDIYHQSGTVIAQDEKNI